CEGVGEGMEDRKAQVVEDALSGFGVRPVDRDEHTRIDFRKQYVAGVQTAEVTTMAHTPRGTDTPLVGAIPQGGPFRVVLVLPVEHHLHGLRVQHSFTVELTTVEQGKHETGHVVGGGDGPTGRGERYPIVYGHGPVRQVQGDQIVRLGELVELTEFG